MSLAASLTKLITPSNAEITIPNSVLVENTVINFSQRLKDGASLLSTKVTIGYDTPWRQVHAMLILAAGKTPLLSSAPAPYVFQRALTDFYVEYELFAAVAHTVDRVPALSTLHGAIQDVFNEHGVRVSDIGVQRDDLHATVSEDLTVIRMLPGGQRVIDRRFRNKSPHARLHVRRRNMR